MPVTTTLKLSDALKQRIAKLAAKAGVTPHAFMVEALETETRRRERRREFVQSALLAEQEVARYGEAYAMDDAHRFFRDKLAGTPSRRPAKTSLDHPVSRRKTVTS